MSSDLSQALRSVRLDAGEWSFVDLRIDIPPLSYGSDAANPHTQYSNAVAMLHSDSQMGIGAAFTLGEGNQLLCEAAQYIVGQLSGVTVGDLMDSSLGFYETLANPLQLRWLSPYAGVPMMAAGLISNTVIDAAAKRAGLPAWEFLAKLPTSDLMSLVSLRHIGPRFRATEVAERIESTAATVDERCEELRSAGLPVYYTTWIGHSANDVASQIKEQSASRGIKLFKVKIGPNIDSDLRKLAEIQSQLPAGIALAVDANQTLTYSQAVEWLRVLSDRGIKWLEEPFAPDNVQLFADLARQRRVEGLDCEIATGENCPNPHTAAALIGSGLDRFQADPCRMMGLVDGMVTALLAQRQGCEFTPHAGGTGLDELSPHLQLLNLARVDVRRDPQSTLTENVGFCSHLYAQPTDVRDGVARTPVDAGYLVGYSSGVVDRMQDFREGISWLAL